ncbi:LOW QUALITY PROTEIN: 5'-AMP-activated protein kinase subunit gamma-1-like [Gordionus sp. m RMFG-2023]|uniref:LOW QUALITY PROTEIN: 5'-AMP-activated protein kinase subunit gamma-1-like n=1 Tax=Gordionus sp. m RMFG-2023 TaxID=3053472 RepID=UPI0031FE38BD
MPFLLTSTSLSGLVDGDLILDADHREPFRPPLAAKLYHSPATRRLKHPSTVLDLEDHKIQTWRDEFLKEHSRPFLGVDPGVDLLLAARLLVKNKVHQLPVLDPVTGNALYILTHKRILIFLCLYIDDLLLRPRYMDWILEESSTLITPVQVALFLFYNPRRVSALPVLSRDGNERVVVDVYAKFDVINLAAERSYRKLDITVKEALSYRAHVIEGVHSCQRWEKL